MSASQTSEPRHLELVDRLRGQYHLPVNDGAGPLNGSMTFSREFPTPPIQKEAADVIEELVAASIGALQELRRVRDILANAGKIDEPLSINGCVKTLKAALAKATGRDLSRSALARSPS